MRKPAPPIDRTARGALLLARLREGMGIDWEALSSAIRRNAEEGEWQRLEAKVEASVARRLARENALPAIRFPPELPVCAQRDVIAAALTKNQVIIVCGETGSGKTTQLPKLCLTLGRGTRGYIGHTQPRRIAARSVATRIAQELGTSVGAQVGFKVRFSDHTSVDAYVKIMTDGILLAETRSDPILASYDTLIIDEAHERSLNIDFLVGYVKQILPRRPDLKIIVTSATLDAQRFSSHFNHAPVIEVSGRLYPVEIRYRPVNDVHTDDEREIEDAIVDAVAECQRGGPGDILVFLPGEREIRETAELLRAELLRRAAFGPIELLPLYARLSAGEQQRVFEPAQSRRVILATNVAETSLTIPGIRYVIDPGLARISRYSTRSKVQLLQIEKISQAAANQRAGRCGRVADGVCIRLYDEKDFAERPAFTEPEILRSSLSSVILRMADLGLTEVDDFPFVERPSPRAITDGYQLLQELGAIDQSKRLTPIGRNLAKLPLDPRLGRMVLAGKAEACLEEILTIVSALSVPDPRDRPLEKQQAADQAHLRFRDERSDFLSYLHLADFFVRSRSKEKSHNRLVAACRSQFLSYLRLREWLDIRMQLVDAVREMGWNPAKELIHAVPAGKQYDPWYERIHRALLVGLLGNVGHRSEGSDTFVGARGIEFQIHPSSGIERKKAKWIIVAALSETTRLYGRCAAIVEPDWIERVAGDLVLKSYFDPRWEKSSAQVVASERTSLYGLPLVARRRVFYGPINPEEARELFIRGALVQADYATQAPFLAHNNKLLEEVQILEHKARRQDVLVDDQSIFAFYSERIPLGIASGAAFDAWRKEAENQDPRVLFMTREVLMRHGAQQVSEEQFPERMPIPGAQLPLTYRFEPGHAYDGVTVSVPLAQLNQLDSIQIDWLVPGMIRDKVNWIAKALPKNWRNRIVPHVKFVTEFLTDVDSSRSTDGLIGEQLDRQTVIESFRGYLEKRLGECPPAALWANAQMPAHLAMNIRVVDGGGAELAASRDLGALRRQLGEAAQLSVGAMEPALERGGMSTWEFGELPEKITFTRLEGGRPLLVVGYPALVDEGAAVGIRLFDSAQAGEKAMRAGVRRLLELGLRAQLKQIEKGPPGFAQSALQLKTVMPTERLLADVVSAIYDRALINDDDLPRTEQAFAQQKERAKARIPAVSESAGRLLAAIGSGYHALMNTLSSLSPETRHLGTELREQYAAMLYPGFFGETPWDQLQHFPRYLQAMLRRIAKYAENPKRDAQHARTLREWNQRYLSFRSKVLADSAVAAEVENFKWILEELRVSLFAQELKTPYPVSIKRLEKIWGRLMQG